VKSHYPRLLLVAFVASATTSLGVAQSLDVPTGFDVEQLYEVPREQGSWVSMTFDPQGRMIVSHEDGGLYRVTPSPIGKPNHSTAVEQLAVNVGGAHGLLYAFDSLYAISGGVLRLRDTNGDGQFDSVKKLLAINGSGEHGPHAIVLGPQKKWLYVIAGNVTPVPDDLTRNRIRWAANAKPNPQGWVVRIDPEGKRRELFCVGLRNAYGLAMHPDGELFTFDSDNEGYMGLPWYRPTNIYHLTSGADYGWRQGPETLQPYHPDNLPPVLEVGPGSPTGMVFGSGANFPSKYQRALFVGDWSYGRIYAIHLRPMGGSYQAEQEFFISGRPLAVTDLRIGPDGAMYFLTGGRGIQSALYRVTWTGEPGDASQPAESEARKLRRRLASFHGRHDQHAVAFAWPHLRSDDRSIRSAARIAIEHQGIAEWQDRAFTETNPQALLEAMIAVARQGDKSLQDQILRKLTELDWNKLDAAQRLAFLRTYEITFQRMGTPQAQQATTILAHLNPLYPNANNEINRELITLLVDLKAKGLIERTIMLLQQTPTAMRQIHFLLQLNGLADKPTDEQRQRLIATLDLEMIRDTGARNYADVSGLIASLLKEIGVSDKPERNQPPSIVVREWTMEDLSPLIGPHTLESGDVNNGQAIFRKAQCHRCHRIGSSGGVLGPNLTGLSGRFKPRDVLETIVEPDKVISDQYRTTVFIKTDGTQFTGQIVNFSPGMIQVRLDPSRPFPRVSIPAQDIEEMHLSAVSLMPKGLLNSFTQEEIQDLMAFLLSRDHTW
jgi:putative heme-binding domain-containing protein